MASKGFTASTAADYALGRPNHNVDLMVRALKSEHGMAARLGELSRAQSPVRIVDVGAGTGKSLEAVAAAVNTLSPGSDLELHAVEPSGLVTKIAATVPEAFVHTCEATALPFEDGSVDLVSIGQAFHWFAGRAALREVARVLRPGGRLLLSWNTRDACSTLAASAEGVGVDATEDAIARVEVGGGAGLPAALETAVESFYSPDVPRQQSGAWLRYVRLDGSSAVRPLHLPAGVSIEVSDGPGRLTRFGPFGRFGLETFRAGAELLGLHGVAAGVTSGDLIDRTRRASEGGAPAGAGEEAEFAVAHWRTVGAMLSPAHAVLSSFRSVSVVAAGDEERRRRVEAALEEVMRHSPTVEGPGGERLHVLPLMQDVFVGRPLGVPAE